MDPLETLVRDALAEHADDAPAPGGLLEAVSHRPHRLLAALTAAAVVMAVAVGIVVFRPNSDGGTSPAAAAPGTKPITYHGVTVYVPRALPVRFVNCSRTLPTYGVVEVLDEPIHCPLIRYVAPPARPRPVRLLVNFAAGRPAFARTPVSVDGTPARRGYGGLHNRYVDLSSSGALVVPSLHVSVVVSAPTRAAVDAILDTATVTATDANGCPTKRASLLPGNPPATQIVPGYPDSVVRCRYSTVGVRPTTHWLTGSRRFGATTARRVAAMIDTIPPSIVPRRFPAPTESANSTWIFGYPDGSHREIGVERMARTSEMVAVTDGSRVVFSQDPTTVGTLSGG